MNKTMRRTRGARVLLPLGVTAMVAASPARGNPGRTTAPPGFSAEVEPDRETGWGIVVLRYREAGGKALEVRVAPAAGSNLFSLKVDGDELMYQPEKLAELKDQRAGTPLMFPMVNRVRDGKMVFEERTFSFEPNNGKNFIHGLARRRPFQIGALAAKTASGATAETFLEWNETEPEFARFPIKHRLTVTYTLKKTGITIAYQVDNRDGTRLPFAFGLHPYFRIPGRREDVTISAPPTERMEAIEYLPTGKLIPVDRTAYDLRRPVPLSSLALDDVYFGMTPEKSAAFTFGKAGPKVELGGSADFTHLVVFTPPDKPFFCIENQTSSTDAHNLHQQGKKRVANLQVLGPGKTASGQVTWTVRRR
jgi:aldose 1-epimerase